LTLRSGCDIIIEQYRDNYKKVLLSEEKYFEEFVKKMNFALDN
jgi:hypothetical protein